MAEQDSGQERTEQATPRRLQKARDEGQVPRSRELTTMGLTVIAAASLFALGPAMVDKTAFMMREFFVIPREALLSPTHVVDALVDTLIQGVLILVPFFVLTAVLAFLLPMLIGGWSFSAKALAFKFEKLDPVKGVKRIFGPKGAVEFGKAFAKFVLIAGMVLLILRLEMENYVGLAAQDVDEALAYSIHLMLVGFLVLTCSLVLVAAIDVPFQIWDHGKQLRMTRQELKDEFKETEGKPELKSKMRQMQQEVAQRRMMEEVPKADVIITNPTHYAVALRYSQDSDAAPVLLAKGADLIALRIRELGNEHGVMILEAPMVARAVYHSTEIGREIPAALYTAVAQILAYVFQLKRHADEGTARPAPIDVNGLDVPDEMTRPNKLKPE